MPQIVLQLLRCLRMLIELRLSILRIFGSAGSSRKKNIKEAADGNGGIFNSMRKAGIIDELEKQVIVDPDKTIYLECFGVQTAKQGRHIGSSLVREIYRRVDERNLDLLLFTNVIGWIIYPIVSFLMSIFYVVSDFIIEIFKKERKQEKWKKYIIQKK